MTHTYDWKFCTTICTINVKVSNAKNNDQIRDGASKCDWHNSSNSAPLTTVLIIY